MSKLSYGVELELADIDTRLFIPKNIGVYDYNDYSIANSNGLAIDPEKKWTIYGSEIHTTPSLDINETIQKINDILKIHKNRISVNYTCNLHIHIGIKDLSKDLEMLKQIFDFIYYNLVYVINIVDPLPDDPLFILESDEYRKAYLKRKNRRILSHHRIPRIKQYEKTMQSKSTDEFKNSFGVVPSARYCINMRSIFKENRETIEFRFFTMSLDVNKILNSFIICDHFINCALNKRKLNDIILNLDVQNFHDFNFDIDRIFTQTGLAFTHSRKVTMQNISKLVKQGVLKLDEIT